MKEQAKGIFENINDLIGSLLWPALVLFFFYVYRKEISQLIKLFIKKIEISSKVSFGSLSFEIVRTATIYGNEDLGIIIKNLDEESIRKLLMLGGGNHSLLGRDVTNNRFTLPHDYEIYSTLDVNGLIEWPEPFEGFLDFFKNLDPEERIMYKHATENFFYDKRKELSDKKLTQFSVAYNKLSQDDYARIERFGFKLSEQGKKAFDIIVQVVASQITKE